MRLLTMLGQEFGFEVTVVADVKHGGQRISATRVRNLLASGNVEAAAELLGYPATVRGLVVHGAARGRNLGFCTANIQQNYEGLGPADGIYACIAKVRGKEHAAAVSVGGNPTFTPDAPSQIEVHLLDFDGDIYGEMITVKFYYRLRGMAAFAGLEELVAQMREDVRVTALKINPLLLKV